jgi:FkbM family methyltransferase
LMALPFKVRFLNAVRRIFQVPLLERGLAALTRGKAPQHFICRFVPSHYLYRKGTMREIRVDGIRMIVDVSDYIGHYYLFGFRDPAQANLFALCKEHFNVMDIGANIGFTVLKLATRASRGKVIGFEPDPVNFSFSSRNLALNGFDNAKVLNIGLGASEGEVRMEVTSAGNRGGNRISATAAGTGDKVKIRRLDSLFPELNIASLDLVKIDVEGYELHVLNGGEQTIRKHKPVLFVEVDDNHLRAHGHSAAELIAFIRQLGYRTIVKASGEEPVTDNTDFRDCHFDIIAR